MASENRTCNFCKESAELQCAGCHLVVYCCKEHQKTDWKTHKKQCKPYQVMKDDVLGRHLVATRNLKPGDIVFREAPLIWGPSQVTIPVCLGCGKGLSEENQKPCLKCGWPMCSDICQNSPAHIPECSYTVNRGDKVSISAFNIPNPSYQCITPLRCLYNKQFLPDVWQKLDTLQSHCDERKKTPKYEGDRILVATFIRRFFKLDIEDDIILRICGIINVNAHEVPLSEPTNVAIYHTASMFEHSCNANCSKTFTPIGEILFTVGSKAIKKGEHLSICYTDSLWGTTNRRHHLHETKFFWCECPRCQDVSEFGTYFSCINCNDRNCTGIATPKSFLTLDDPNNNWECQKCHKSIQNEEVSNLVEDFGKKLQDMQKGSSQAGKLFIKNALKYFPNNHFYLTDVKLALTELIGQEFKGGLGDVSDDDLLLKIKICKELLGIVDILAPAENRARGPLLFELHSAIAEHGQRKVSRKEEGPDYLLEALVDSKKYLLLAIEALKHEPSIMPEGRVCQQAKINLRDINVLLASVQASVGQTTG